MVAHLIAAFVWLFAGKFLQLTIEWLYTGIAAKILGVIELFYIAIGFLMFAVSGLGQVKKELWDRK